MMGIHSYKDNQSRMITDHSSLSFHEDYLPVNLNIGTNEQTFEIDQVEFACSNQILEG